MWTKVSEENGSVPMPEEEEIEDIPHWIAFGFKPSDTADDILLGDPTKKDLRNIHPTPLQIFELWQTFLANINPLTHIVHAPTLQDSLYKACEDMSRISRGLEALMFAMYCSTVNSMSDQECQSMLGEPRDLVLMRFIYGCRQALINSLWLRTSEMMVLQAYTLFLVSHMLQFLSHHCYHKVDHPPSKRSFHSRTWLQIWSTYYLRFLVQPMLLG